MWLTRVVTVATLLGTTAVIGHWTSTVRGQAPACLVSVAQGALVGVDRGASCEFRGVPFAAPPLDALRWARPVAAGPWGPGVLQATANPPVCPQINRFGQPAGIEDCLKLNVWAPHSSNGRPLPVIVWFHGGSFISATGFAASHNGARLVELTEAIVVAPNYRLGPLGFLGHRVLRSENSDYPSAGNYGLLDQRLALEWVRTNIAAFGGDPHRITIAGQSAGGLSVSLHLVSPGSHGLFDRAIMQGGFASYRWRTREDSEAQADLFATRLGCTDPAQVLACLRGKSRDEILRALPTGMEQFAENDRTHWGPIVDGLEIPDQPRTLFETGTFSRVPVIIGSNRDEGWTWVNRSFPSAMFTQEHYESAVETEFGADAPAILAAYPSLEYGSPKNALSFLVNDAEYACGAERLSRLIERTNTPVYLYQFEYAPEGVVPDRAPHGLDVSLLFGTDVGFPILPSSTYVLNVTDLKLFRSMARYWRQFAETGDPNNDDVNVHWPAFSPSDEDGRNGDRYLILDRPVRPGKHLREPHCAFWEPYFFRSITAAVPANTP
jgi:para-nitrobenzyl esterase